MATQPPSKKESMKASNIPLSGSDQGATLTMMKNDYLPQDHFLS
jgi:hypothetical protein